MIQLDKNSNEGGIKIPKGHALVSMFLLGATVGMAGGYYTAQHNFEASLKPPAKVVAVVKAPRTVTMSDGFKTHQVTEAEVYAALFRSLRIDRACIDYPNDAVIVRFPAYDKLKEGQADTWKGWWSIPIPRMYYLAGNKTWYNKDIPDGAFTQIWPISVGHPCGDKKDYEDK